MAGAAFSKSELLNGGLRAHFLEAAPLGSLWLQAPSLDLGRDLPGVSLGLSWASPGCRGASLGPLWRLLGPLWGISGPLGPSLGPCWSLFGALWGPPGLWGALVEKEPRGSTLMRVYKTLKKITLKKECFIKYEL